jgi:hypothetical protein
MPLPTLSELAIPTGITLTPNEQIGGGGEDEDEGEGGMLSTPILRSWLVNNIEKLQPTTMIPVGVLIATYNQFTQNSLKNSTIFRQLSEIVGSENLKAYMKSKNLKKLTLHTELPFAIIMGPDVFKQII